MVSLGGGTLTWMTDMGPVSAVRSQVPTLGTSPQPTAGISSGGSAVRNGGTATAAAPLQTSRPVPPAAGVARPDHTPKELPPDPGYAVTSAKARAEAAHRAYLMAQIAAGLNPLNDPVP
jgi:hypothetical protein